MNEETALITFKAISNFINDIATVYGKKYKPVKKYRRIVNETQISQTTFIQRHITLFQEFCLANREAISAKDHKKLQKDTILYPGKNKITVNMKTLFSIADSSTTPVIWKHLLTISALVDPAGNAKRILLESQTSSTESTDNKNETDFLTGLISKVEQNVKPDSKPEEMLGSILNSGIFTDILQGMQGGVTSGQLNLQKLIGSVSGLVANLEDKVGDDPEAKQMMGMFSNLSSNLSGVVSGDPNARLPDLSGMMGMLGTLGNSINTNNSNPE